MNKQFDDVLEECGFDKGSKYVKSQVPLEYNSALSDHFNSNFYLKREDLIDQFGCGIKLRKLHYILNPEALEGVDVIVTSGSLGSNQCKAVAIEASKRNIRAHLVYGGDIQKEPSVPTGSYQIAKMFKPDISWFPESSWDQFDAKVDEICKLLRSKGNSVLRIGSGASEWPGILGSVELGFETISQIKNLKLSKPKIVIPFGSGGTAVGMEIAAEVLKIQCDIYAVVINSNRQAKKEAQDLKDSFFEKTSLRKTKELQLQIIQYSDDFAYDQPSDDELDQQKDLLFRTGVYFDYNYNLRALLKINEMIPEEADRNIIYALTGGSLGYLDSNPLVKEWEKRNKND